MYRFALSFREDMHIENLRIALFNYISAKQNHEKFLILIDDRDKEQNIDGKDQEILEILQLFGIEYDQIIYQSENLKFHQQLATKLLMDKNAFVCFCTAQKLENDITQSYDGTCKTLSDEEVLNNESPFLIRIKRPQEDITFSDIIEGKLSFTPDEIDDFVIMNVDKTPTGTFAYALDDLMYDISMVIKQNRELPNTPKEILIRKYLGYDKDIKYAHLPIILNENGKPLCKEDDLFNVKNLLLKGFLPSAICNYIITMGNDTPKKFFSLQEALTWFDLSKISKTPVKFEIEKLRQLNKEHIRNLDSLQLSKALGYSSKEIGDLAKIYTHEDSTLEEIKLKIDNIFKTKNCEVFVKEFEILKKIAKDAPYHKSFDDYKAYLMRKSGLNGEAFFKPLQVLLTGTDSDIDLSEIYPHIKNYLGEIIK